MAVSKKSLKNLDKGKATQFSKNNQPENPGRKKSALSFAQDAGVSLTDIKKIISGLIWEYDSAELAEILKNKNEPVPMGIALVLGALADDLKSKSLTNFEKLMDRAYGKSAQPLDMSSNGLNVTVMTPEERDKRIKELVEKSEPKKIKR